MLTVKQAAAQLGVSEALIYGWCAAGQLVHLRLGGKNRRGRIAILETDLADFLASCRQGVRPEAVSVPRAPPLILKHLQL